MSFILDKIKIKKIKNIHKEKIIALYKEAGWWNIEDDKNPGKVKNIVKNSFLFVGAFNKKNLIGMARVLSDVVSDAYIQDVIVKKEFKNKGIGKKLINFILEYLEKRKISWIGLISVQESEGFYKKLGFDKLENGFKGNFCLFEKDYFDNNEQYLNYFKLIEDRNNANYIYTSEKLAQLSGRKLHGKRNLISQFIKNYPDYKIIYQDKKNLNCESFRKCIELADKWIYQKELSSKFDSNLINLIKMEEKVLKNSCNYFKETCIGLTIVEIDENIIGFSVFSEQTEEMATIHFEKYNSDYIGISQFINNATAKFLQNKYKYINREDDLGVEQLRFAKNSYLPDNLLIPYLLIRN